MVEVLVSYICALFFVVGVQSMPEQGGMISPASGTLHVAQDRPGSLSGRAVQPSSGGVNTG